MTNKPLFPKLEDFQFSGPQKLCKVTEKPFNTPQHHQISIVYLLGVMHSF